MGVVLAALAGAPAVAGELLHWRTPDGREGLADDPSRVPPNATVSPQRSATPRRDGGGDLPSTAPGPEPAALDPSGDVQVSTHASFSEVLSSQARVIAVYIPIDPPGLGIRQADAGARAFVGGSRASSVFPTPPREALEARTFAEANEIARTITGKGIS